MKIGLLIVALAITGSITCKNQPKISVANAIDGNCKYAFTKNEKKIGKWHNVNKGEVSTVDIKEGATHASVVCYKKEGLANFSTTLDQSISIKDSNTYKTNLNVNCTWLKIPHREASCIKESYHVVAQ